MITLFKKTILSTMVLTMLVPTTAIASNQSVMSAKTFDSNIDRDAYYQQFVDNMNRSEKQIEINLLNADSSANDFEPTNFSVSRNSNFQSNASRFGFNIASYWQPFRLTDFDSWGVGDSGNINIGVSNRYAFHVEINHVLLRDSRNSQNFAYAYRVVMSPNNNTERFGFLNLGVRGDQWLNRRQNTSVQLQSGYNIGTWAPMNMPATGSSTIGVGLDSSGRPSISGSITRPSSELTIISRTNVGNRRFEAEYDYNRGGWHRFWTTGASNYLRNSVVSFGFFTFHTTEISPRINIVHQARFETQNLRYPDVNLIVNAQI